jgi:N-acetylglucosamine-6-phosphate deacetylase
MSLPSSGVLSGGRVVTPDGVLSPGWIRLAGTRIDAVGPGEPPPVPGLPVTDLSGRWVLPGFVDMHVHGGGGTSFTEGTAEDARRAAEFHRRNGSTTILASLVTAPLPGLEARAAMLAGLAREGVIAGLHLEGPFLAPARCGAQDPRHMIAPDVAAFASLHAAAAGQLRVITLAPELPGATALIKAAAQAGVIAAVGHTDATADVTSAAVDAGASHATHLFNGMRPLHHREPGPVGALLDRDEVSCEVIADGVHLHDTVIRLVARAAGPGRLVLITDAMAAAGMPDGRYRLGSMRVDVAGGVARLAAESDSHASADADASADAGPGVPGAIAGSTATMAGVVRHAVAAGLPVIDVAAAASTNPARVLGLGDRTGALRPGLDADLVVCDEQFGLRAVMRHGKWLGGAPELPLRADRAGEPPAHRADLAHHAALAGLPGALVRVDVRLGQAGRRELRVDVAIEPARATVARVHPHRRGPGPGAGRQRERGEHLGVVLARAGHHGDLQGVRPGVDALAGPQPERGGRPVGDDRLGPEPVRDHGQHPHGHPDQGDDPEDDADHRERADIPVALLGVPVRFGRPGLGRPLHG